MADGNQVPVVVNKEKSLLKTRLLDGEKIIAEFAETPGCGCFSREGRIRRIQLTNRRINYYEAYRKLCCFKSPPLLRQIFFKDVCEIAVDNYGHVAASWMQRFVDVLITFAATNPPVVPSSFLRTGESTSPLAGGV
ncbi:hypothetical protein PI125_g10243, partial [Phytophthora idaei]